MLGAHLNGIRLRRNKRVVEIADETGIPPNTVYVYLSDRNKPSPERLGLLLDALDATPGERLDALTFYTSADRVVAAAETQ